MILAVLHVNDMPTGQSRVWVASAVSRGKHDASAVPRGKHDTQEQHLTRDQKWNVMSQCRWSEDECPSTGMVTSQW